MNQINSIYQSLNFSTLPDYLTAETLLSKIKSIASFIIPLTPVAVGLAGVFNYAVKYLGTDSIVTPSIELDPEKKLRQPILFKPTSSAEIKQKVQKDLDSKLARYSLEEIIKQEEKNENIPDEERIQRKLYLNEIITFMNDVEVIGSYKKNSFKPTHTKTEIANFTMDDLNNFAKLLWQDTIVQQGSEIKIGHKIEEGTLKKFCSLLEIGLKKNWLSGQEFGTYESLFSRLNLTANHSSEVIQIKHLVIKAYHQLGQIKNAKSMRENMDVKELDPKDQIIHHLFCLSYADHSLDKNYHISKIHEILEKMPFDYELHIETFKAILANTDSTNLDSIEKCLLEISEKIILDSTKPTNIDKKIELLLIIQNDLQAIGKKESALQILNRIQLSANIEINKDLVIKTAEAFRNSGNPDLAENIIQSYNKKIAKDDENCRKQKRSEYLLKGLACLVFGIVAPLTFYLDPFRFRKV